MSLPTVRKIVNDAERLATIQAAKNDNDAMHFPTHVVMKDGEIVGGWCLGGIPLVMMWNSTTAINAKESMILNNMCGAIMNDRVATGYFIACNNNSPYISHMARFGFEPVWPTNIFYRQL